MRPIEFLDLLLAGDVDVAAADGDDVVPAVGGGVVGGFVLAHEGEGDAGGDAAEGLGGGADVEVVPGAGVGEFGLVVGRSAWIGERKDFGR